MEGVEEGSLANGCQRLGKVFPNHLFLSIKENEGVTHLIGH